MKIWHQSCTEIDGISTYRRLLLEHAHKVLGDTASIEIHGIPQGRYLDVAPSDALGNPFALHVILEPILNNVIQAEKQGFDAFVVGSFAEPFLRELRSAVDIPVVSLTESSLLIACSLGRYSAPISNAPTTAWTTRTSVETHGLNNRVLRVSSIDPPLDEKELAVAFDDPLPVVESFRKAARKVIAEGADVIIPAEGMLAALLYGEGLQAVDEAPVIDVFAAAWTYASMLVRLRQTTGLQVGRSWHYRRFDQGYLHRIIETHSQKD